MFLFSSKIKNFSSSLPTNLCIIFSRCGQMVIIFYLTLSDLWIISSFLLLINKSASITWAIWWRVFSLRKSSITFSILHDAKELQVCPNGLRTAQHIVTQELTILRCNNFIRIITNWRPRGTRTFSQKIQNALKLVIMTCKSLQDLDRKYTVLAHYLEG